MYSFDDSEIMAEFRYQAVCGSYDRIFKQLDLPIVKGSIVHMYLVHTLMQLCTVETSSTS